MHFVLICLCFHLFPHWSKSQGVEKVPSFRVHHIAAQLEREIRQLGLFEMCDFHCYTVTGQESSAVNHKAPKGAIIEQYNT